MNHTRLFNAGRAAGVALALTLALGACSNGANPPAPSAPASTTSAPAGSVSQAQASPQPAQPGAPASQPTAAPAGTQPARPAATAAPVPSAAMAARVNGLEITRARLDQEVARYMAGDPDAPKSDTAEGKVLAAQLRDLVLDGMIEQILIEQEAAKRGIRVTDKDITDEINAIIELQGGQATFHQWLKTSGLTDGDLREIARQELVAANVRDRVTENLPKSAEYVHASHILVNTEAEARTVLQQLQGGARFDAVAKSKSIDPSTAPQGGDLDWFAKGTGAVLWEEVEAAAFQLRPGQTSGIVKSPVGFHIVRVTERETRALTAEDVAFLQQTTFEQWLDQLKATAKIERSP